MWLDYNKGTPEQQATFREINPKLGPRWGIYAMYVTKRGKVARNKGRWNWTHDYAVELLHKNGYPASPKEYIREYYSARSKGDLREFKTADFHLDNKFPEGK